MRALSFVVCSSLACDVFGSVWGHNSPSAFIFVFDTSVALHCCCNRLHCSSLFPSQHSCLTVWLPVFPTQISFHNISTLCLLFPSPFTGLFIKDTVWVSVCLLESWGKFTFKDRSGCSCSGDILMRMFLCASPFVFCYQIHQWSRVALIWTHRSQCWCPRYLKWISSDADDILRRGGWQIFSQFDSGIFFDILINLQATIRLKEKNQAYLRICSISCGFGSW